MASQTFDLSSVDKVEFLQGGVAKEVNILKLNDTVIWKTLPYVEQDFIFTVERYTTNTYVDDTSYTDDEIIAFDVEAGEGGCTVTYEGRTRNIEANTTKQVIYGKYKGVNDGTPTSGTMTISGDYTGIKQARLSTSKSTTSAMKNVTGVTQWFGSQLKSLSNFFLTNAEIDAPELEYSVNITSLIGLMAYSSRTTIPVNLIKQCVKVTSFYNCFAGCTGITSIPEDLFKYNPAVTSFDECFNGCTGITQIPANLFISNPAVTSFYNCFAGCTGITAIPTNLFVNNTLVTTYEGCFKGCTALTGTTPVNAGGLELWQLAGTTGYPETITGTDCFTICTGLSNYTNIPSDWGGGATA